MKEIFLALLLTAIVVGITKNWGKKEEDFEPQNSDEDNSHNPFVN